MIKVSKVTRIIVFALVLVVLCAACARGEDVSEPTTSSAGQTDSPTKETSAEETGIVYPLTGERVTLTYWTPLHSNAAPYISTYAENEAYQKVMEDTNVNIVFEHPALGQEETTLSLLIASGDMPDIVQYGNFASTYSGGMDAAIDEGVIIDLTDLLSTFAPDYFALVEDNILFQTPNKRYPAFYKVTDPSQADSHWCKIVTRKDYMDEWGHEVPHTLDELEAYFQWILDNKPGVAPFTLPVYNSSAWYLLLGIFDCIDGWYVDQNNEVQWGRAAGDEYLEYLTTMNRWYEKGYLCKDWSVLTDPDYKAEFVAGSIATVLGSGVEMYNLAVPAGFGAQTFPCITKDENSLFHAYPITSPNGGDSTMITTKCENVETAVKFLNYGYTKEGMMTYNYGVQGLSWDFDENGEPKYYDRMLHPEKFSSVNANYIYRIHFGPKFVFPDTICNPSVLKEPEVLAYKTEWDDDPRVDSTLRLPVGITLTPDEDTRRAQIMTDVATYAMEMHVAYINGEKSLSTYKSEYLATIDSMGFQEAKEITQAGL